MQSAAVDGRWSQTGEIHSLRKSLTDSSLVIESLKDELSKTRESEAEAKNTSNILRVQLDIQKSYVKHLKSVDLGPRTAVEALREAELTEKLRKANAKIDELKLTLLNKEAELKTVSEDNQCLGKIILKCASCRTGEISTRDEDHSSRIAELEAEVSRLKVKSEQWKKAAEAGASIISSGDDILVRSQSSHLIGRISSSYSEGCAGAPGPSEGCAEAPGQSEEGCAEAPGQSFTKKNGNVLKKIGGLLKRH